MENMVELLSDPEENMLLLLYANLNAIKCKYWTVQCNLALGSGLAQISRRTNTASISF